MSESTIARGPCQIWISRGCGVLALRGRVCGGSSHGCVHSVNAAETAKALGIAIKRSSRRTHRIKPRVRVLLYFSDMPRQPDDVRSPGGYCCKSRKSNDVKSLAKVDFWPTWPLQYSVTPIRSSLVVLVQTMWSLISPRAKRISGPEKFRSPPKKAFCNSIPEQSRHPAARSRLPFLTQLRHHPSGTPAMRRPSYMRSRPARKFGLSLNPAARKRRTVKPGLNVSPACAAARASSSSPSCARAAAR